ncbi:MAG TPA: hypothetical protein VI504_16485 [Candidatus Eisenbacteria bacterium]|jgi:hypothetical protein
MLRSLRTLIVLVALLIGVIQLVAPRPASTLPLFARDRKVPCTTCHMAFPRLNPFGMQFKQNGYRMPGEKGTSPWEKESFPISLIGNVGADWLHTDVDTGGPSRFKSTQSSFRQNWVEFHTCGTLAEKVTFHFDNGFSEDSGLLESGMAFVQFDDVAADGKLNVKLGIFDGEIPYLSDARRTTMAGYLTDWTQDNRGIELNGRTNPWMYAAGVVNSDRTQGKAGSTNLNQFENVYGWLTREINNCMVTARVRLERQDPRAADKDASTHMESNFSLYLTPSSGRFAVIPAVTLEHFSDVPSAKDIDTGMVEAIALLDKDGRWVGTGRFEDRRTLASGGVDATSETQAALNLAYYVNPNARVALDWTHNALDHDGPKADELRAFVHVGY